MARESADLDHARRHGYLLLSRLKGLAQVKRHTLVDPESSVLPFLSSLSNSVGVLDNAGLRNRIAHVSAGSRLWLVHFLR